jgi:hypothetical protein
LTKGDLGTPNQKEFMANAIYRRNNQKKVARRLAGAGEGPKAAAAIRDLS